MLTVYVNLRRSQGLLPPPSCHPVLCPMYRMLGSSTQFVRHHLSMYSQYSPIYSHKFLLVCSYEFCTCQGLNKFPMFVIVSSRVLSLSSACRGPQPRPDSSPAFAPRMRMRKLETNSIPQLAGLSGPARRSIQLIQRRVRIKGHPLSQRPLGPFKNTPHIAPCPIRSTLENLHVACN